MSRSFGFFLAVSIAAGCQQRTQPPAENVEVSPAFPVKIDKQGLHNVFRITDKLISGSSPDGDDGFRSLRELGVKTIISVDGARPDLVRAHACGMRYVHLPFGYDGIPRERVLELAKAVDGLPGLVYLHCHHGKHRGPAAAAAIHLCLDEKCSVEQAIAELTRAGTDPRYRELFKLPKELARPTAHELETLHVDFLEVAPVPDLARLMVEIDARWDNLGLIREAGWKTPPNHPDLEPQHEVLQLFELYREAGRLASVQNKPQELQHWLSAAEKEASELESILRTGKAPVDRDEAFRKVGASCARCHATYRDAPLGSP